MFPNQNTICVFLLSQHVPHYRPILSSFIWSLLYLCRVQIMTGPHHAGASSFLLHAEHPIFEHIQSLFFPLWHRPSVTLVLTRILAHWIGPVSNKCTKHSEKSLPLLPESYKQLNRIGISRETDRRTPGSGVFRLPSTFLWLGSRNCGWRQGRTRRSLLHPMFREQLCS